MSIQVRQENLHVNRTCEFDSSSWLQKGHNACWGQIIPFPISKSPVFSFSSCANQIVNCALGGTGHCHIELTICMGIRGGVDSYNFSEMVDAQKKVLPEGLHLTQSEASGFGCCWLMRFCSIDISSLS